METTPASDAPLVVIVGRRGVGKTYLANRLARGWPPSRVWAFNPRRDSTLSWCNQIRIDRPPPTHGVLHLWDECQHLVKANSYAAPWVERAVLESRHFGSPIIATAVRPALVHGDLKSQYTTVYLGCLLSDADIDNAVRWWGRQAERARELPEPDIERGIYPQFVKISTR